jgi:hypothetical protein
VHPGRLRQRLPWLPEPMAQATRVTTRYMAITFVVQELACLAAIRPALRSHDTDLRPYTIAVAGFLEARPG